MRDTDSCEPLVLFFVFLPSFLKQKSFKMKLWILLLLYQSHRWWHLQSCFTAYWIHCSLLYKLQSPHTSFLWLIFYVKLVSSCLNVTWHWSTFPSYNVRGLNVTWHWFIYRFLFRNVCGLNVTWHWCIYTFLFRNVWSKCHMTLFFVYTFLCPLSKCHMALICLHILCPLSKCHMKLIYLHILVQECLWSKCHMTLIYLHILAQECLWSKCHMT